jgi:hypothetical protein
MDVHKPKPWAGWRELLKEIGTIVVGVLIAISFEAIVERLHWAHEVRAARVTLAGEMGRANEAFAFRAAAGDCIDRRLDALDGVVEAVARHAPVARLGSVLPDVGNAFYNNIWEAHRAAQTLTHFDAKELNILSAYYFQLDSVQRDIISESDAWGYLRVLEGDPARLGPADLAGIRVALRHARFQNTLITGLSGLELDYARSLHLAIPTADAQRLGEVCAPLPLANP